jgi:hypothetical protein
MTQELSDHMQKLIQRNPTISQKTLLNAVHNANVKWKHVGEEQVIKYTHTPTHTTHSTTNTPNIYKLKCHQPTTNTQINIGQETNPNIQRSTPESGSEQK